MGLTFSAHKQWPKYEDMVWILIKILKSSPLIKWFKDYPGNLYATIKTSGGEVILQKTQNYWRMEFPTAYVQRSKYNKLREYRGRGHLARLLKNVMERETSARRLPPARRSAEVYLQRRVAILEKQVKSLRLAAGALAEAAYLGDTLEPSDSEDEMEAESDLDNGDEEITSDGEDA